MRRTVAIDLDGVVYDLIGGLSIYLLETHRVKLDPDSVTTYNLAGLTGNPVVDTDILRWLRDPRTYLNLPPYPEAHDGLYALHQAGFHIIALTRRPLNAQNATAFAQARDFPDVFSQTITTKYKMRAIRAQRARFAIEDHGDTALEFARNRIWTYLIGRPYNRNVPENRFLRRVSGIDDVARHLMTPLEERLAADIA